MEDIQIVTELKRLVQEVYPESIVYFYGSRANQTNREDSDYDVLVILNEITPVIRDTIYDLAWEVGFKYSALISPVLAKKSEFTRMSGSPFFNNIRQTGLLL